MQQIYLNKKKWPDDGKNPKYLGEREMLHNIELFQLHLGFWAVTVPPTDFALGVMGFQNQIITKKKHTYLI